jgi:uncharacterized protein (UPF0548 family)
MVAIAFCAIALVLGSPFPALRLTRPSAADMDAFVRRQHTKGFNQHEQGHILRYLRTGVQPIGLGLCERWAIVGHGQEAYDRVREAISRGDLLAGVPWATIRFVRAPQVADDLATVVRCYRCVWCLSPCRVTHVSQATTRSTLAYATLDGHLLEGEEAFDVHLERDGRVRVRVVSLSKGAGLIGKIAMPLIAPIRRAFLAAAVQSFVEPPSGCSDGRKAPA